MGVDQSLVAISETRYVVLRHTVKKNSKWLPFLRTMPKHSTEGPEINKS